MNELSSVMNQQNHNIISHHPHPHHPHIGININPHNVVIVNERPNQLVKSINGISNINDINLNNINNINNLNNINHINNKVNKANDDDDRIDRHIERRAWGPDEDEAIKRLVAKNGTKSWAIIATALARDYNCHGKTAKQCRERWYNHLNPTLSKAPLTEEEERILLQSHNELGNKWAEIAKRLPGRSDNHVKNYWYSYMRRESKSNPLAHNFVVRSPPGLVSTSALHQGLPLHVQHQLPPMQLQHQLISQLQAKPQAHLHQQQHQQVQQQPFIFVKKPADDSDSEEDENEANSKKRQKVI